MADGASLSPVRTTCPYCGVGCGVLATPTGADSAQIAGDRQHPSNYGKLCSKGSALGETLGKHGRLLAPFVEGRRTSWDTAMARVADGFRDAIERHGPDSVAFYLSGQLLTEDYYVANKLMKGFIGSANVDTNSRLCMASAVAGHKRAFGADIVPGVYEDFEECDLLVLVGSNLAWCHPVLYQRVAAAKQKRPDMRVVVIDPRRTASCDIADLHLPLRNGSDVALFQGLFKSLHENGFARHDYIRDHTSGADAAAAAASAYDIARVARETCLAAELLHSFYEMFAQTPRTVTAFSMGVNQASDGADKVNAIINVHLLTGRIGIAGAGPFSLTGQPNAMGGREVGGLANQLACHMDFDHVSRDRVRRFWRAPNVARQAGLKAVDLFEAVAEGRIKAIWIMATNPVVSMPDADRIKAALKACPLVVVSDIVPDTDTARCANVLLPAAGWGEKDGTVTNSERRISRQRAFLPPPGLARADWRAICDLAARLGHGDAFAYRSAADIFREYAAMTAFENDGARDLDLGALADLSDAEYEAMAPIRWPAPARRNGQARFFAQGGFYTEDRRARFIPSRAATGCEPAAVGLVLNTGRVRDQWHTMTRTGRAARLNKHIAEPFCEIHPNDAAELGVKDEELVVLENSRGRAVLRALVTDRTRRGSVFAPMHWTGVAARQARVDALVTPAPDPVSGQPALKSTRVTASPLTAAWYGFAAGAKLDPPPVAYWARARAERGERMELAGEKAPADWREFSTSMLAVDHDADLIEQTTPGSTSYRCAFFARGRLLGVFIAVPEPVAAARDWLCDQIGRIADGEGRRALLAGHPPNGAGDPGAIICSCLGVGRNTILAALRGGAGSLAALGDQTGAGANCGSCRPELRKLMELAHVPA